MNHKNTNGCKLDLDKVCELMQSDVTEEVPDYIEEYFDEEKYNVYKKALSFASEAHKGATRKGTSIPYFSHVLEASLITSSIIDEPNVMAAAALHDVVEDTDYNIEDIREEFGLEIAEWVQGESEDKMKQLSEHESWEMRKRAFLDNIINESRNAKIICLSDKISNMRSIKKDYEQLGDQLWERFNMKDKTRQAWYYQYVATALDELKELDAYKEYCELIDSVFENC